jgi:hypothetical protein
MPNEQAIRQLVRTTLGCTCPEAVFDQIERSRRERPTPEHPYILRLVIGKRLLIYVLDHTQLKTENLLLNDLLAAGQRERDAQGYNRFRAVLSDNAVDAKTEASLQAEWQRLAAGDERVHLHLVHSDRLTRIVAHA